MVGATNLHLCLSLTSQSPCWAHKNASCENSRSWRMSDNQWLGAKSEKTPRMGTYQKSRSQPFNH
jgi:hypothetical protein